ncbi:hypothetical protein RZS08_52780, partial [Arthrospira platensis SPKY1]|nr:hypothetical protein [Arthrospira platensis SPKY1]
MGVELCAVGECPINYQTPLSEIASYPMLKRLCTIAFVILILPFSSPLWAAVEQKILLVGDSLGASYGVPSDKGWVA